ncbi:hypothetical protein BJ742DRAFT_906954 [Cladochytrium replicatum]|nr:hypothetical protein BJ742DRAFT_906954 [Cladochytrium replicatum]
MYYDTSPRTTSSLSTKAKDLSHFELYTENFVDGKQLIGLYMRYRKQHPEDDDLPTVKDMDSAEYNWKNYHRLGTHFLPTHFVLGADPGKGDFTGSQVQDTYTTPKVNSGFASIKSFRWYDEYVQTSTQQESSRNGNRAENLRVRQDQSSRPSLVTTDPQQVDSGICWFVQYIKAMLAHYTTLNNHAEWHWRVYRSKQRASVQFHCHGPHLVGRGTTVWTPKQIWSLPGEKHQSTSSNAYPAIWALGSASRHDWRCVYGLSVKRPKRTPRQGGALDRAECGVSPVAQACPPMSSLRHEYPTDFHVLQQARWGSAVDIQEGGV